MDARKKAMIKALEQTLGVVTPACRLMNMSRQTHYNWLAEDPQYAKAYEDLGDMALDLAESQLHQQILDKNIVAIIFFLKTKGKKRGYIEQNDFNVTARIDIKPKWFDDTSNYKAADDLLSAENGKEASRN